MVFVTKMDENRPIRSPRLSHNGILRERLPNLPHTVNVNHGHRGTPSSLSSQSHRVHVDAGVSDCVSLLALACMPPTNNDNQGGGSRQ